MHSLPTILLLVLALPAAAATDAGPAPQPVPAAVRECTLDGADLAGLRGSYPVEELRCLVAEAVDLGRDPRGTVFAQRAEIRVATPDPAELARGIRLPADLVTLFRQPEGGAPMRIGRALVPIDISRGAPAFVFRLVRLPAGPADAPDHAVEIGPKAEQAFLLAGDGSARTIGTAGWVPEARALVPAGFVAGEPFDTDLNAMAGHLAAFRAGADDPASPGSAFDPGWELVARLELRDGALAVAGHEWRRREAPQGPDGGARDLAELRTERDYAAAHRALQERGARLPAGTMPCELGAWSADRDPKGLNVRAGPSAGARVLGRLPPPFRYKGGSEAAPEGGWRTEFTIVGYKDGWFLIEGATPPGRSYEDGAYPRRHPKPYPGRGWVAAAKVGAAFANGDTRMGGLFQAPHVDARWTPAKGEGGEPISVDGGPKRIIACSGLWALVESHDGVRGWWRRICSNQVTNCS
ncbi:MAG TPA: hypothetical protein VF601_21170 [Beijerinckiaceae bacterium]|jgi:hypothetical protein